MNFCLNRSTAGRDLPADQFVALAAKAGFDGADVDLNPAAGSAQTIAQRYQSQHMQYGGWGPSDWRGQASLQGDVAKEMTAMAKIAGALRIDSCATWIMPSSDLPFMENWEFHVSRLKPMAKILAEQGLRLGLEFVAPYHLRRKFKHEFIFTPGLMLELADAVGKNVGLLVDVFHCHCAGVTWDMLAAIPGERIVLAHLNDAPQVPVPQVEDGNRVLPGQGAIDIPGFLAALQKTGYAGPVSLEVFSAELRAMPAAVAAQLAGKSLENYRKK
jgi:sugar phosphate isomerase/epimerase